MVTLARLVLIFRQKATGEMTTARWRIQFRRSSRVCFGRNDTDVPRNARASNRPFLKTIFRKKNFALKLALKRRRT